MVFILFVFLVVVMPIMLFRAEKANRENEKKYNERGISVHCTVTTVMNSGKHQYVEVIYRDKDDQLITAKATPNKKVTLGEEFTGYVLPETPEQVYCPAGAVMKYIFYGLFALLYIGGWAAMIIYVNASRTYRILKAKGIPAKGELVSISNVEENILVKIRFTSASGREHTKEFAITHGTPFVGDMYDILYYEKPNGRCVADLIDFKLR